VRDAIFADDDGGTTVVDWKTGEPPDTAEAGRHAAIQLAVYRLAWAQLHNYPLETVSIPAACGNDDYEARMRAALVRHRDAGVTAVVCGDIFLEDVRRYREERLFTVGLQGRFPLWGRDSRELARRFLTLGFRAVLCCIDTQVLGQDFAGRDYDEALLADLPPGADPCGENGEFHTFVHDGPGFARPVPFSLGERVLRDGRFGYCDLLPMPAAR